jgi:hypothetical protein
MAGRRPKENLFKCVCGHSKGDHGAPGCLFDSCPCMGYRIDIIPPPAPKSKATVQPLAMDTPAISMQQMRAANERAIADMVAKGDLINQNLRDADLIKEHMREKVEVEFDNEGWICVQCGHEAREHFANGNPNSFAGQRPCLHLDCPCGGLVYHYQALKPVKPEIDGYSGLDYIRNMEKMNDLVNHPAHYTSGKIEVWDFILDQGLSYCLGNVVKYVCRTGKKDPENNLQDLEKARAYLDREIKRLKES